jgi:hypothetical protein
MSYAHRPRRAVANKELQMIGRLHLSRALTSLALVAAVGAVAAQSAFALDARSPDTREAATPAATDFRSPDTREAAATRTVVVTDVRSPDTQQAAARAAESSITSDARDAATRGLPPATPTAMPAPTTGFDWGDFGIGVAAGLGAILMVALLAAVALSGRGKRRGGTHPATT